MTHPPIDKVREALKKPLEFDFAPGEENIFVKPSILQAAAAYCKMVERDNKIIKWASFLIGIKEPVEGERSTEYECIPIMVNPLVLNELASFLQKIHQPPQENENE